MKQRILKWLTTFFWRKWLATIKATDTKPVGIPYQRDPEHPCNHYEPAKTGQWSFADCETDGHYLCAKCCHNINNNPVLKQYAEYGN